MENNNNKFKYTYSAPTENEKKEIEEIRNQYREPDQKDIKLNNLKKLDKKVKLYPLLISLTIGIVGFCLFGLGFSFILEWNRILIGILMSLIGIVLLVVTNPIYTVLLKRRKDKYKEEILKLSDELLNNDKKDA